MADPATYRPAPGEVPTSPGVYRFRDQYGRVIYVGKAKNLRARLANYFQPLPSLHPRTQQMVLSAASVEWTVVATEVESLALEYSWIKEYDPRFNVKYRDDKSYPYLAVTMAEEFPRATVMRGEKKKGTRYFGPYGHAWAIRETLDLLLRVFPIRTCSSGVFNRAARTGRPCLLGYIDKCSAPCVGRVSPAEHRAIAEDFCRFMAGDTATFVARVESAMRRAATDLDFETAARLRDDLAALQRATERNAVVLPDGTDADIFALASDELEAAVQVFHVRGGRIRGQRGWIVEKVEDIQDPELVEQLLVQVYGEAGTAAADGEAEATVPREIIVPVMPANASEIGTWLTGLRGSRVNVHVAMRGDKRELAATVHDNATHALRLHKMRRSGDLTTRSAALQELQEALELDEPPLRIECYDISHTQGTYQAGSMVVFEDGLARKSEYRTFNVRGPNGDGATDDTAAMHEVLVRRFRHVSGPGEPPAEESGVDAAADRDAMDGTTATGGEGSATRRAFAYPPSLIVVDGGPPQVAAARRALDEAGATDVRVVGLAKRLEEVWLPGQAYPVVLERTSQALYLLQRLRDEAHRFAITAHRKRRSRGMTSSVLDGIPGVGPARVAVLLDHFRSVAKLKKASLADIEEVAGMGPATARAVYIRLHGTDGDPVADPVSADGPVVSRASDGPGTVER